jgi:D-2-hydroxyglutarate dehydrogenase
VIGLEVVLASGEILDLMSRAWKDNTGIDMKHLFIGSEGSLGVITKARLHCPSLARFKSVALIHSDSPFNDFVINTLRLAHERVGESLAGFEFFDSECAGIVGPLPAEMGPAKSGFTVLVEASGSGPVDDRLTDFIASLPPDANGIVSTDLEGIARLWHYRESIPVRMAGIGPNLKFDVSLPQDVYYRLVEEVREKWASHQEVVKIVGYGHVGDGNLHLNVALRPGTSLQSDVAKAISNFVYGEVAKARGSISAEHGVGRDKLVELTSNKSSEELRILRGVKKLLDPNGILNPGRTIP